MTAPTLPALVDARVHHTRHSPIRHVLEHTTSLWLLDLDAPPDLPQWARPFVGVRGEDHLTQAPGLGAVKAAVLRELAGAGIDPGAVARVVMLAGPRSLGHAFDPMTAYWCLTSAEVPLAVVIEVRNTYGGRHVYVIDGEESLVDKAFHVSPFNRVEGRYAVRAALRADHVAVAIRLLVDDQPRLTATVSGPARPATRRELARMVVRRPLTSQRVSALIRLHGVWLWLRRLPVTPRPHSSTPSQGSGDGSSMSSADTIRSARNQEVP